MLGKSNTANIAQLSNSASAAGERRARHAAAMMVAAATMTTAFAHHGGATIVNIDSFGAVGKSRVSAAASA
jgi:uncharacterized protein (UPF0303 family)